jgi:hypothetical protein
MRGHSPQTARSDRQTPFAPAHLLNVWPMIDFSNGRVFTLNPCGQEDIGPAVAPILNPREQIVSYFKAVRDFVVAPNFEPSRSFTQIHTVVLWVLDLDCFSRCHRWRSPRLFNLAAIWNPREQHGLWLRGTF